MWRWWSWWVVMVAHHFIMRMMVWYFVNSTHKNMTTVIIIILIFVLLHAWNCYLQSFVVEFSLQYHGYVSVLFWLLYMWDCCLLPLSLGVDMRTCYVVICSLLMVPEQVWDWHFCSYRYVFFVFCLFLSSLVWFFFVASWGRVNLAVSSSSWE